MNFKAIIIKNDDISNNEQSSNKNKNKIKRFQERIECLSKNQIEAYNWIEEHRKLNKETLQKITGWHQ